jgi:class 3 adenylate cyclase/tetratricopeptide (TPR) repeat protein
MAESGSSPARPSNPRGDVGSASGNRSERRVVTVLFCDVADSTAIAERLDPEDWVEILDEAFRSVVGAIERYEGTVVRLLGDAVLAYFGAPIAHEDDPERAILASLAILEDLRPFQEEFRKDHGAEFAVRIGMNTGEAIVGSLGVRADEYTALGDAVNVAARMQQAARPGTILMSADTYQNVSSLVEVQSLGQLEVKGKSDPVSAFQLLRYCAPPRVLRGGNSLDTPIVGRSDELAKLERALDDLELGRGGIVLLIGETGIGKTRLIDELHRRWSDKHRHLDSWLESRAMSYDVSRPYGLFQQLLPVSTRSASIGMTSAPDFANTGLSFELTERLTRIEGALGVGVVATDDPWLKGQDFQQEMLETADDLFRERAKPGPLVLVFDDLHWADPASADVLIHLFQLAEEVPVLFLCAMRPERQTAGWRVKQAVESDYPHRTTVVQLSPLSQHDSDDLIGTLLSNGSASDQIRLLVRERTEGNPLFIEELTRSIRERADELTTENSQRVPVPESLQALLTARIDRLDSDSRNLLQHASVIGRTFSLGVLEHLVGHPVERDLNTLERAGLIEETERVPNRQYSFRHDLMREVAYASILRRHRRALHRQVAETIESVRHDDLDDVAHQLAYHFSQARDHGRARIYAIKAAERAAMLYANTEAIEHYSLAIELARETGESQSAVADLLMERGRLLGLIGEFDRAQADWEDARSLGRVDNNPHVEWRALNGLGELWTGRDYDHSGEYFQEALEVAQSIDDPAAVARSLVQVGNWHVNDDRPEQARGFLESALEIFERIDDRQGIAGTEDLLGIVADIRGDLRQWRAHFDRAIDLYRELDNRQGLASALATLGVLPSISVLETIAFPLECRLQDDQVMVDEALAISREIGWRSGEAYAMMTVAIRYFANGEFSDALDAAREVVSLAESIDHKEWSAGGHMTECVIYRAALSPESAIDAGARAVSHAQQSGSMHWLNLTRGALASAFVAAGRLGLARETLAQVAPDLPALTIGQRQIWLARGELALRDGNPEEAISIIDRMLEHAPNHEDPRDVPHLSRLKSEALLAAGRVDEAMSLGRSALTGALERGTRSKLWRFYLTHGRILRRAGRDGGAEEAFLNSRMQAGELGASIRDGELRDEFLRKADALILYSSSANPDDHADEINSLHPAV